MGTVVQKIAKGATLRPQDLAQGSEHSLFGLSFGLKLLRGADLRQMDTLL